MTLRGRARSTFQPMDRKLHTHELGRLSAEAYENIEKLPVHVVLDNVRSHHNVGSVFRTMDAFRMEKLWLCGITPAPPHRDIQKTALGAQDTVIHHYDEDVSEVCYTLQNEGFHIVCVEQTEKAVPLQHFVPSGKIALVFGNEVNGVSNQVVSMANQCVEIPQSGTKHSLNISVSAGIALWHVYHSMSIGE